jgi:exonuclease III
MGTHLLELLTRTRPDIIALTETLHTRPQKALPGSVRYALRDYHFAHTAAAPSAHGGHPVGGLLLGVRRRAVVGAGLAFSPETVEGDDLQGRHASLAIDRGPAGNLRIQAVYLPAGDSTADAAARAALYQRLERHLLPADAAGADLVLGDMNAALRDADRTHALYARDKAHQRAAERLGLQPFEAPEASPRLRTYHTAAGLVSRIDDALTTCPEATLQEWRQHIKWSQTPWPATTQTTTH